MTTRMLTLALLLLLSTPAHAALVRGRNTMSTLHQWTWTGQCVTGCQGTATFVAVVPTDTVPAIGDFRSPILSAVYSDSVESFDLAVSFHDGSGFGFLFPASGMNAGFISEEDNGLQEAADGTWRFVSGIGSRPNCNSDVSLCNYAARGSTGCGPRARSPGRRPCRCCSGGSVCFACRR